MKLTIEGLKDKKAWEEAGVVLPEYDIAKIADNTKKSPKWLHFGVGNIFRIFIGGIADKLISEGVADTGIVCAETFDYEIIDKIYKPYDNLVLAVTLKADGTTDKRVVASLAQAVAADSANEEAWNTLKSIFTNDSLQMISFTITEKGYALKGSDGDYLPFIKPDVCGGPENPKSAMAVVTALLYERYLSGKKPLAVVSMDNCSHNGEKLQNSVTTMAGEWLERGFVDKGFIDYISDESKIAFPWTMIDKITPRPSTDIADGLEQSGIEDMQPVITSKNTYIAPFVNAEGPQYLVVEDKFPNGRPELEKGGVYLTDRDTVNEVERMKVTTCLNPLHTALAVYGCLLGYTLISEEMKDEELVKLIKTIGYKEGLPVVVNPGVLDPKTFIDTVIGVRLPNPFMPDAPQRIATDTSQKLAIRFGETIKNYKKQGLDLSELKLIPLVFAGWLRYLMGIDDNGNAMEVSSDPLLDTVAPYVAGFQLGEKAEVEAALKPVLENEKIFGVNLYDVDMAKLVCSYFEELIAGPGAVRATLKKYV